MNTSFIVVLCALIACCQAAKMSALPEEYCKALEQQPLVPQEICLKERSSVQRLQKEYGPVSFFCKKSNNLNNLPVFKLHLF